MVVTSSASQHRRSVVLGRGLGLGLENRQIDELPIALLGLGIPGRIDDIVIAYAQDMMYNDIFCVLHGNDHLSRRS